MPPIIASLGVVLRDVSLRVRLEQSAGTWVHQRRVVRVVVWLLIDVGARPCCESCVVEGWLWDIEDRVLSGC
jgi:hypothetical protein